MIYSELSVDDLLKVAQTLAGHQTNKIEIALEKHILHATPSLVRRDLGRIGVVQCQGCSIWWWADQVTNGYCHSLCGGSYERIHQERIEAVSENRKRQWKFSLSQLFRANG